VNGRRLQFPADGVHVCTFLQEVGDDRDTVVDGRPVQDCDVLLISLVQVNATLLHQLTTSGGGARDKAKSWMGEQKHVHTNCHVEIRQVTFLQLVM